MRKVILAAAAGLLAGAVLPVHPAVAQEDAAFVQWTSPDDGARLSGNNVHIKAKVGVRGGVRSWAVEVAAPDGETYPGWGTVCEKSESRAPAYVTIDCVWDTTAYPEDRGASLNRPYVVRVSTQGTGSAAHTEERNVVVANPVSPPRDVRLAFVDSTKQATVRWAANPEPDIASYVVQERIGDGPWKNVGQAGGKVTTFTRNLSAPGTYRYQVAALRSAGSDAETIQSSWSAPVTEPKQIVVAEPKRPEAATTTTQPPPAEAAGDTGQPGGPAPGGPGAPVPSVAASPNPGDPAAAPGGPAPAGGDVSRNGAMVTPIAPGAPGSVKSGGATVGGTAPQPTATTKPNKELDESEGPDTGYSTELPYQQDGESTEESADGVGRVLVGLPEAIGGDESRQVLVPLAAGLLLFVFAMHALYISRRAGQDAQIPLETD